ncbi:hypothetical protein Hanom_Chr04g00305441 [Helianthus anomalus]
MGKINKRLPHQKTLQLPSIKIANQWIPQTMERTNALYLPLIDLMKLLIENKPKTNKAERDNWTFKTAARADNRFTPKY